VAQVNQLLSIVVEKIIQKNREVRVNETHNLLLVPCFLFRNVTFTIKHSTLDTSKSQVKVLNYEFYVARWPMNLSHF
jgi:hypothetical protein